MKGYKTGKNCTMRISIIFFNFWTLPIVEYFLDYYRTQRFGKWICSHPQVWGRGTNSVGFGENNNGTSDPPLIYLTAEQPSDSHERIFSMESENEYHPT
jgi:hypothetical protein